MSKKRAKARSRPVSGDHPVIGLPTELSRPLRLVMQDALSDLAQASDLVRAARMCLGEGKAADMQTCLKGAADAMSRARRATGQLWKNVDVTAKRERKGKL